MRLVDEAKGKGGPDSKLGPDKNKGRKDEHEDPAEMSKGPSKFARMKGLIASLMVSTTVALVGVNACSNEETGTDGNVPIPDASTDTDHDGGEGGADAGPDVGGDGGGLVDGGNGGDGGGLVDGGEGGADAGPVACEEASTGSLSAYINAGTPYNVGGYVFTYNGLNDGLSGYNALVSITCGGSPVEEVPPDGFPLGMETAVEIPADGKRIRVHPHTANPMILNVSIIVENM